MAVGVHFAPVGLGSRTHVVRAAVPTGPPVYVRPECTTTGGAAFLPLPSTPAPSDVQQQQTAGRVPPGFTAVRAVKCASSYEPTPAVIQSETTTPADLQKVLAALRPPLVEEPDGPIACPAIGQLPVAYALVDAQGTAVRVDFPRGICGLYVDSALQRLSTVHWSTTGTAQAPLP
jgi:hypothetical protein